MKTPITALNAAPRSTSFAKLPHRMPLAFRRVLVWAILVSVSFQSVVGSTVSLSSDSVPAPASSMDQKSPETLILNRKATYHIALTPREAKKYQISKLRDYSNAVYTLKSEKEDAKYEEFYSDGVRIAGLAGAAFYLFKGATGFASSRAGNFLFENTARVLGVPGTGYAVKAIGIASLAIVIPLTIYQTFTTDPDYESFGTALVLMAIGQFDTKGIAGTIGQLSTPFEIALFSSNIMVHQKTESRSFIARKFRELFGLDYPSQAKVFYRAINRVRLHADQTCQVFGGGDAASSVEVAKLISMKLTRENFDQGEVWLDGKVISYQEALFHQNVQGQDYYIFKEPFNCHKGLFRSEVSINDLIGSD